MEQTITEVEILGRRIHEIRGGEGEPLLYLHSAMGEAMWIPHMQRLAESFELHAPAHPGFLTSQGIDEIRDIEDLVYHYLAYMDAMGWESVDVLGMSLGGWIAAEIAALYPHRVSRLVLVDAVGLWLDEAPIAELFSTPPPELARLLFHDQEHPIAQMMRSITSIADIPQEFALAQMKALEAAARIGWNPYMHDPKLERRLVRVTAPTLVLWGRQDGIVSVAHGERYRDRIRGARLEVLEACGHLPPIEKPVAFAEAALRFLTAGR